MPYGANIFLTTRFVPFDEQTGTVHILDSILNYENGSNDRANDESSGNDEST